MACRSQDAARPPSWVSAKGHGLASDVPLKAKIEFVAFLSRLLRRHGLQLDESASAIEVERGLRLESRGSPVTLIPPDDVKIRLVLGE